MSKKLSVKSFLIFLFISITVPLGLFIASCGSSISCNGTIFVNLSGELVIVSASSASEIEFDTFLLENDEEEIVCGNDTDSITADYEWPNGDTASLGQTNSAADICIFLLSDHTASSGVCL